MITIDYVGIKKRYKSRNMYTRGHVCAIRNDNNTILNKFVLYAIYSYDTLIGYLDMSSHRFYTWGYSRYSRTTSKQITMLCKELMLKRYYIVDMPISDFIERYYK